MADLSGILFDAYAVAFGGFCAFLVLCGFIVFRATERSRNRRYEQWRKRW